VGELAEVRVRGRCNGRLGVGFDGWDVEASGPISILRRADATPADVRTVLAEIADLGLELESLRRLQLSP
jgi:hypothetical protein